MALNVSNKLMLLVQKIKKKQLVHITTSTMSHIELACGLRAVQLLLENAKIDALIASALKSYKKEVLQTIYNLTS